MWKNLFQAITWFILRCLQSAHEELQVQLNYTITTWTFLLVVPMHNCGLWKTWPTKRNFSDLIYSIHSAQIKRKIIERNSICYPIKLKDEWKLNVAIVSMCIRKAPDKFSKTRLMFPFTTFDILTAW